MIGRHDILMRVWDGDCSDALQCVAVILLRILSLPYQLAVAVRNNLYDYGWLRSKKLSCPVISIGNLSVGGTGKTPLTILLAGALKAQGLKPAVLSRGYGRQDPSSIGIVSDGRRILMDHQQAGDEPFLIAQLLPEVPVIVGPDRFLAGKKAIDELGADILILDDGFQHRLLYRDIDIVLLPGSRPLGNGHLLPAGSLREPPDALSRADIIVLTGGDREGGATLPAALLPVLKHSARCFQSRHEPRAVIAANKEALPLTFLQGKRIYAFSGIGTPLSFLRSIADLGAILCGHEVFPDHHAYIPSEVAAISINARRSGADYILTTEKDGVRLLAYPEFSATLHLLRIEMAFIPEGDSFFKLISETVKTITTADRDHLTSGEIYE